MSIESINQVFSLSWENIVCNVVLWRKERGFKIKQTLECWEIFHLHFFFYFFFLVLLIPPLIPCFLPFFRSPLFHVSHPCCIGSKCNDFIQNCLNVLQYWEAYMLANFSFCVVSPLDQNNHHLWPFLQSPSLWASPGEMGHNIDFRPTGIEILWNIERKLGETSSRL